jgi:MFS family permease
MSLRDRLGPLHEPQFARFFAAVTISMTGSWASTVALGFGVLATATPTALGLVFLAREIPIVLLVLAGGVWADRLPRRVILASANALLGVTQLLTAAALLRGWGPLAIGAFQVVNGCAAAFSRPAMLGFIPELVRSEHLQQANALLGLTRNTVALVGTTLGAALVSVFEPGWALVFDAITFLIAAPLVATVGRGARPARPAASPLADLHDGWKAFVSRRWVCAMVAGFGLFQLSYFPAFNVLGPYQAEHHLNGAASWAIILSAGTVGAFVGSAAVLRLRPSRPLVLAQLVCAPVGLELILLGVPAPVPLIAASGLAAGFGLAVGDTLWETTLQRHIPGDQISRISSFDWLGSVALNPLGYVLVGPLAAALGASRVLYLAGAGLLCSTLLVSAVPAVRALPAHPEAPPADVAAA